MLISKMQTKRFHEIRSTPFISSNFWHLQSIGNSYSNAYKNWASGENKKQMKAVPAQRLLYFSHKKVPKMPAFCRKMASNPWIWLLPLCSRLFGPYHKQHWSFSHHSHAMFHTRRMMLKRRNYTCLTIICPAYFLNHHGGLYKTWMCLKIAAHFTLG